MTTNKLADTFLLDLENLSDESDDEKKKLPEKQETKDFKLDYMGKKKTSTAISASSTKILDSASVQLINNETYLTLKNKVIEDEKAQSNIIPSSLTKDDKINNYIIKINTEIVAISNVIKDVYSHRFPELESLILNPYEYAITVSEIGNNIEAINKLNLGRFLPNHTVMAITIMSSTTSGKPLKEADLSTLLKACKMVIGLNDDKNMLLSYIKKRMNIIAPNLSAIIGPNTAAKLITAAGGIVELSKMPACNVLVLGAQRKNLEGFSTANKLHRGYLTETDIYKNTPEDYQKQALRKLSTKCVLAARYDAFRSVPVVDVDPDPTPIKNFIIEEESKQNNSSALLEKAKGNRYNKLVGEDFKDFIMKKMNKIQEPQQPKQKKILPRPDDKPRRKRGGKRMRSLKLRMEQTEIRKMKNRMNFGPEQEVEFRESGKGFGVLGVGGTGSKLKATVNKGQKINTKKQKLAALQAGVSGNNSGLCSSVVIEAPQGISLINPELLEKKISDASNKYFSNTSGFTTVINSKKNNNILEL